MARNDPFEADLHGLWAWKIGSAHAQFKWAGYGAEWRRQNKMAAEKGTCPVEGFYRGIGSHVHLKVYDLSSH